VISRICRGVIRGPKNVNSEMRRRGKEQACGCLQGTITAESVEGERVALR
jgi:hypothetical protein